MLINYLKMAWRSLVKNKISSIVNIGGLALGLAISILILLVVLNEFSYNNFHKNISDIYLLMKNQNQSGGISTGSSTAGPMAPTLRSEMPEVKYASRLAYSQSFMLRVGDKTLYDYGIYVEPDFFNMMSFASLSGDPANALKNQNNIVITEGTAKKLFGTEDPVGNTIQFDNSYNVTVASVIKNVPSNSSIQFNFALPFQAFESKNEWLKKWDDNRIQTWMQLKPTANIKLLNERLTKLLQVRSNDTTVSLFVYPLARQRLYGSFDNGKPSGGNIVVVKMISIIGVFILLIACINFMNLSTATSAYRSREVGVRKVLGASRKKIIFQFLCEALLISLFALFIAIALVNLALPSFNLLAEKNIYFDYANWRIWISLTIISVLTGLVAGSYPAFLLSGFKVAKVLKGTVVQGRKRGVVRQGLVIFQFVISIFFITGTIVVFTEINHVKNRPIGYEQENLIDIHANGNLQSNFDIFKNELSKVPRIRNISAGSDNLLEFGAGVTGMDWPGKTPGNEVSIMVSDVQYNWIKTTGLKLIEGRDFSPQFGTDTMACLVNQSTIERLGLKEPVLGIKLGGKSIIGVFQNFVYNNPSGIIAPMAVYLNTGKQNHFFVRISNDAHWRETLAAIESTAKKINPSFPFEFSFTKESYQRRFEEFNSYGFIVSLVGGFSIFISCLGLFGLSVFLAIRRRKEISIRKVFGASVANVGVLLSRDFLKPVLVAFVIVTPISIIAFQAWLSNIPYHIHLSWWMFAVSGLAATFIALLTVSYQGIKTSLENPVRNLRNE